MDIEKDFEKEKRLMEAIERIKEKTKLSTLQQVKEIVRDIDLNKAIAGALKSCEDAHGEITIPSAQKRIKGAVKDTLLTELSKLE